MPIVELPYHPVAVGYAGGGRIRHWRGAPADAPVAAEEWIGSTTPLRGGPDGVSTLADGRSMRDLIATDPHRWLGREATGSGVLVKILDPASRIPVHGHPDAAFARRHLGVAHGKAEAWVVLSETARVWLGPADGTDPADFEAAIDRRDTQWLLAHMHRFDLGRGDAVFVPPGVTHAIDADALLAEVQEPLAAGSLFAEYWLFGLDADRATLGTGWEAALGCIAPPMDRAAAEHLVTSPPATAGLHRPFPTDEFFWARSARVDGSMRVPIDRLTVVIAEAGEVVIATADTVSTAERGSAWLVGACAGEVTLDGTGHLLLFGPPRP